MTPDQVFLAFFCFGIAIGLSVLALWLCLNSEEAIDIAWKAEQEMNRKAALEFEDKMMEDWEKRLHGRAA
jgi:hypothetical protein